MAVSRGPLGRKYDIGWSVPDDETTVVRPTVSVPSVAPSRLRPVPAVPDVTEPSRITGIYTSSGGLMGGPQREGDGARETPSSDVQSAVVSARQELAEIPGVTGERYADLVSDIEDIAAGESDGGGGSFWENLRADRIFAAIQDAVVPDFVMEGATAAGEDILRAVAVPGRTVESVAKELTDLVTTDPRKTEFSVVDLITQPFDYENFNPEYSPVSSAIELFGGDPGSTAAFFDSVLGFVGKAASDPTTYLLATPLGSQGAVGRQAAAQKLLSWQRGLRSQRPVSGGRTAAGRPTGTAPLTGGVPEPVASVAGRGLSEVEQASLARDIYRYGIDKLPAEIRDAAAAAGILPQAGVRVYGQRIPWTEGAGETLALGINRLRAKFGDIGGGAVGVGLTPRSRAPLAGVARAAGEITDPTDVLDRFATVRAAQEAKSAAGQFTNRFAGRYGALVKELSKLDENESAIVIALVEGEIKSVSPGDERLLRLAQTLASAQGEILFEFNAARQAISNAAGLRLEPVGTIDNYVHRTLTDRARSWFRKPSNKQQSRVVADNFGVDAPALRANEGFTMSRKLDGKFLDETLQTGPLITKSDGTQVRAGTIEEINSISRKKLGFDMFESRAEKILANYIQSVGKQLQRQTFIDRMFQFRPGSIAPLMGTSKIAQSTAKVVDDFNKAVAAIDRAIAGGSGMPAAETVRGQAREIVSKMGRIAREVSSPGFAETRKAQRAARVAKERLDNLQQEIAATRQAAESRRVEIDQAALDVLAPLEARVKALQEAIARGEGEIAVATEWLLSKHRQLFPDMVDRPTAPAELARDIIRETDQKLSGAARSSVVGKTERMAAQAKRQGTQVDVQGAPVALSEAKKELPKVSKQVRQAETAWKRTVQTDPVLKEYGSLNNRAARAAASYDAKSAIAGEAEQWMATVGDLYAADIKKITDLLNDMPKAGDGYEMTVAWVNKVKDTFDSLVATEMDDSTREALTRVLAQLFGEESLLARREGTRLLAEGAEKYEQRVRAGLVDEGFTKEIIAGWEKISEMQVQVSPQLANTINGVYSGLVDDMVKAIARDGQRTLLGQMYDISLGYFKGTAILTLGFTTRNAVTAAFNNWIAGVSIRQMKESLDFARNWRRYGLEGAYTMLGRSSGEQAVARMRSAVDALLATGGGKNVDEIIPVVGRKNRRRFNNKVADYTVGVGGELLFRPFAGRLSATARRANEWVEIGMRLPLALNSIDRGGSVVQAAAAISRFQFDYSDLSPFDEQAKLAIPFWVFASRNIPLQTINRAIAPGKYNAYDRFQQGMEQYEDPEMSSWRKARNPISWLGGWYTDLDLPFQNLAGEAADLTSFPGLIGQASPFPRAVLEGVTGQRVAFGTSYPYSDDFVPVAPLDPVAQLVSLVAGEQRGDERVVRESDVQSLTSAFPALGNAQRYAAAIAGFLGQDTAEGSIGRVVGGQERYYTERDKWNTLLAAFGVPLQRNIDAERDATNQRRIAEIQQELRKIRELNVPG